jgi:hypothetical protein
MQHKHRKTTTRSDDFPAKIILLQFTHAKILVTKSHGFKVEEQLPRDMFWVWSLILYEIHRRSRLKKKEIRGAEHWEIPKRWLGSAMLLRFIGYNIR